MFAKKDNDTKNNYFGNDSDEGPQGRVFILNPQEKDGLRAVSGFGYIINDAFVRPAIIINSIFDFESPCLAIILCLTFVYHLDMGVDISFL